MSANLHEVWINADRVHEEPLRMRLGQRLTLDLRPAADDDPTLGGLGTGCEQAAAAA